MSYWRIRGSVLLVLAALLTGALPLLIPSTGYASAAVSNSFTPVNPVRAADTRSGAGVRAGIVPAGGVLAVPVAGRYGVPSSAGAAALNVTVTRPVGAGYVTAYPCGQPRPVASNLNFVAGQTIPNAVLAKIGSGGTVCLYASAAAHLIVDINGWFPVGTQPLGGAVQVVSLTATGAQANGQSGDPAFSPDGTKIAFISRATNLVSGDTNGVVDVFVKDLITGSVQRASTSAGGGQADGSSGPPVFSPVGNRIAFGSSATNLVPEAPNGGLFVKDLTTGAIQRVNITSTGQEADAHFSDLAFSPDGSVLAFVSAASNLVPGDTGWHDDVFLKDLTTGIVRRISTTATGGQADGWSAKPAFSPDGTKVVFGSAAANLVPGDSNGTWDVFVKDLATGAIQRISTTAVGGEANQASYWPSFFPDGRKVVFSSKASNLVPGDTGSSDDVFVKDLATGAVQRVNTTAAGAALRCPRTLPVATVSGDGSRVAFPCEDVDALVAPRHPDFAGAEYPQVHVKNITTGAIVRASSNAAGDPPNGFSHSQVFSPDGSRIAFFSYATNLVAGHTNSGDVFLKSLGNG